ncbi:restriction endonuclease subunit S [Eggerthella lenta]|uniref:restriction endonuclease subunit S n=1 Tax=Eggerthella lenta TaxID=84112 RepID=UPI000DF86A44|nr:restriction endonuclease subunit S [Eggerthella lenta]RDC21771.1 restriction endonuclease subunit S [Eggerthella lenta]RDC31889.1 restriction endonuclease subunit S [Eggerthella lenta]
MRTFTISPSLRCSQARAISHATCCRELSSIGYGTALAWEQRKLGELCSFAKGRGYSKADICDSGVPLILYGRLYTQYQARIDDVDTFAVEREGSLFSCGNEVIVPASGETAEDIAVASSVRRSGIVLGGDLNVLTPGLDLDPDYVALVITYGKTHSELAKRAQGKSVVHIHNDDIAAIDFSYPTAREQRAISSLALSFDDLITLHQRKPDRVSNAVCALRRVFVACKF